MNKTVSTTPGNFCWIELMTTDSEGAKNFYQNLFGWKAVDDPMIQGGGSYTMFSIAEHFVAGGFQLDSTMQKQGIPTAWSSYIAVEDVAAMTKKAEKLGASVIKQPFAVLDAGVMSVLSDPTGAVFCLWQKKKYDGFGAFAENDYGTPSWYELVTKDMERAGSFYCKLFGWTPKAADFPNMQYTVFSNGQAEIAGMMQMTKEWGDAPSHWMVYFSVENCDAIVEKLTGLGGNICVPPSEIDGVGRFAVVQDPQGGFFSVIRFAFEEK